MSLASIFKDTKTTLNKKYSKVLLIKKISKVCFLKLKFYNFFKFHFDLNM